MEAGADSERGVEVETTEEHENRAADGGCCVSTCCASSEFPVVRLSDTETVVLMGSLSLGEDSCIITHGAGRLTMPKSEIKRMLPY